MPVSTPLRASHPAFHFLLGILLLPALLLGCDSFGTGSSGLSLTADVESISPSDSTVTLTLTNDSPSPIYADFVCRVFMQRKVNGVWEERMTTNPICPFISPVASTSSTTSKLSYAPPLIFPGESLQEDVEVQENLGNATAIRYQVWIEYQKEAFRSPRAVKAQSRGEEKTVSNSVAPSFAEQERYDGDGYLVSEEIQVSR